MYLVLMLVSGLVVPRWALHFEDPKTLYEDNSSGIIQERITNSAYARHMEKCRLDEDCGDPVQKCVGLDFYGIIKVCSCPADLPNYFYGECHSQRECTDISPCLDKQAFCKYGANKTVGICECPNGTFGDDGFCLQDRWLTTFLRNSSYGRTGPYHSTEDDHYSLLASKQMSILFVVAVFIVAILLIGCWRMARRNRLLSQSVYGSSDSERSNRHGSPSARRFLSTQRLQTECLPGHQSSTTHGPNSSSSHRQQPERHSTLTMDASTDFAICPGPGGSLDQPPSYEELFGNNPSAAPSR